jgi:Ni,Fe-hydrogenase III large subunit
MTYRERELAPDEAYQVLAHMSEESEPLGAYANGKDLVYLFLRADGVHGVRIDPKGDPTRSLSADLPLYDWHEREMRQKHNVGFVGHPDLRPLIIDNDGIPPALTAQGGGVNVVVVGPVHAGIIEPGRFTFSTGGETTIHLDAQFSYGHRDIERALEGRDAIETAPLVARICGGCSVARSWAYARALESLAGYECDEPTECARVVFAELERLYNHVFDLASAASGAGYGRGLAIGLGLKERVLALCNDATSHRFMFDAVVPGGVKAGVLQKPGTLRADLQMLHADVDRFMDELFENRSVLRRFQGAGVVDAQTARLFGACGPTRRASGGTLDVRTFSPYGIYARLGVRAMTSSAADVLARCQVKRDEIGEAFRLIHDTLALLTGQAIPAPRVIRPQAGRTTTAVEGPRGLETVSLEIGDSGSIGRIHVISASYRNWPIVARAMEGNIIPDFPLINKSFNLCYSCMDR